MEIDRKEDDLALIEATPSLEEMITWAEISAGLYYPEEARAVLSCRFEARSRGASLIIRF